MDLRSELDMIYSHAYMIRESFSEEGSREFSAGFEDGIREGIVKWLGKAAGKISSLPGKIKKGAEDLYSKGKEWGKKAAERVRTWMSDALEKSKEMMSNAGKWISESLSKFVDRMKEAFSFLGKKLAELWESTKDKSKDFWEATKGFFSRIMEGIKKGYQSAKEWLYDMGEKSSEWVKRNWKNLKDFAGEAKDGLGELFEKAMDMLKKGGARAKKWLDIVALYLIAKPAEKIKEWIKKIPELWEKYSAMFKDFIDRQVREFKLGFEEGSGRPWDKERGFINQPAPEPNEWPQVDVNPIEQDDSMHKPFREDPAFAKYAKRIGGDASKLFKPLTSDAAQDEVEAAAENLAKSPEFRNAFQKYSEADLRSALKKKKFTPLAIDWTVYCWNMEKEDEREVTLSSGKKVVMKKKPSMALPEKFRYLKTFEGFEY